MPIKGKRTHQKNRGIGRGRMFLADKMGWLPGFPIAEGDGYVEWVSVPNDHNLPVQTVRLTRETLYESTYTWNKLNSRFPRALSSIINDVGRWRRILPILLNRLKGSIQQQVPLPSDLFKSSIYFSQDICLQAEAVVKIFPKAFPLVQALGWLHLLDPKRLFAAFEWIKTYQVSLERLLTMQTDLTTVDMVIFIVKLRDLTERNGEADLSRLMEMISQPIVWRYRIDLNKKLLADLQTFLKHVRHLQTGKKLKNRLPQPTRHGIERASFDFPIFVDRLRQADQSARAAQLGLLETLYPENCLVPWADRFERVEKVVQKCDYMYRWLSKDRQTEIDLNEIAWIESEINALNKESLIPFYFDDTLYCIQCVSKPTFAPYRTSLLKFLTAFPHVWEGAYLRRAVFQILAFQVDHFPNDRYPICMERYGAYLQKNRDKPDIYLPWEMVCKRFEVRFPRFFTNPFHLLVKPSNPGHAWFDRLFQLLDQVHQRLDVPLNFVGLSRVVEIAAALDDDAAVVQRAVTLIKHYGSRYLVKGFIEIAHRWAPDEEAFLKLVRRFSNDDDLDIEALKAVHEKLEAAGWVHACRDIVATGGQSRLIQISRYLVPAKHLSLNTDPPAALSPRPAPIWSDRYPPDFHPALFTLSHVSESAEQLAEKVLGKIFPKPESIQQEIDFLSKKVLESGDQPKLIARLANLRKRLAAPQSISPQKCANLTGKLHRTILTELLNGWEAELDRELRQQYRSWIDVETLDPALMQHKNLIFLPSILKLEEPHRQLGLSILKRRNRSQPWHLYAAEPNQAFIHKLEKRGVNMAPWLNQPASKEVKGANGRIVWLQVETDPLEILHMGGHFKTCLTPGAFNFYSAVVNAADVNKQVIYARNGDGVVVGRCLIGLTTHGGIVTFNPYCHDSGLGFQALVANFVDQLAYEMGTLVLPDGIVPPLMSKSWYDDGPQDLSQRFQFLESGSHFRKRLETISPGNLLPHLEEAFAPLPLNEFTLPFILELAEVQSRPELLVRLVPLLLRNRKGITDGNWVYVAKALHHEGRHAEMLEIIETKIVPYVIRTTEDGDFDFSIVKMLLDIDPYGALRLMRQTRPDWIKGDAGEIRVRAKWLIKIYDRIHRPKQKAALEKLFK